jgi:hypothetical protein
VTLGPMSFPGCRLLLNTHRRHTTRMRLRSC